MIVVDTNILAYLYLPSDHTSLAENLLGAHPEWTAPTLWRSEMRNVLALYLRKGMLEFEQAYAIQREAEDLLSHNEYLPDSWDVLQLVNTSECSAYDCEFVALAMKLETRLVTADKKILQHFPDIAISLKDILH